MFEGGPTLEDRNLIQPQVARNGRHSSCNVFVHNAIESAHGDILLYFRGNVLAATSTPVDREHGRSCFLPRKLSQLRLPWNALISDSDCCCALARSKVVQVACHQACKLCEATWIAENVREKMKEIHKNRINKQGEFHVACQVSAQHCKGPFFSKQPYHRERNQDMYQRDFNSRTSTMVAIRELCLIAITYSD